MINGSKIILREKSPDDAWDDYAWEADPELAQLDAAPPVTIPYSQYLIDYSHELKVRHAGNHRFSVYTLDGEHIGNCSYYNLNKYRNDTELGIMIGNRDYWDKGYGADVVTTLVDYIFHQLKLDRIYLKTLESNTRAQKCFQKCGFTPYSKGNSNEYKFILMEFPRNQWAEEKQADS
ncbi:GNAT family N-acetyltransferase [Chloroflexota bacterium]